MGNINPIGREKTKTFQEEQGKEVKGTASSKETKASAKAASEASIDQNAAAFRKVLVEKFGKEFGNKIADALDEVKKSGKFVTYEVVKEIMETVFANDKASFDKYERQRNEIVALFPFANQISDIKPKDDYDPIAAEKVQAAMRKEIRKSDERTEESIEESDRKRALDKEKDQEKRVEKKRILEPKKRV